MDRGKFEWEVADDEEEEYNDRVAHHSIFLIDAGPRMMIKVGKLSAFQAVVKRLAEFLSNKLRLGDSDQYAVVFYSTKESKSKSFSSSGVYTFQEMEKPDIQTVLELERFAMDPYTFEVKIGSSRDYSLFDTLSEYSALFRSSKNAKKTVYLITNQDDPCAGNVNEYSKCTVKAKDMLDNEISLEIVGLNNDQTKFSFDKFYSRLEYLHDIEEEFNPIAIENEFSGLENLFKSKENQKRTLFSIPLVLGDGVSIGVRGYGLYKEKNKPLYSYVAPIPQNVNSADDVGSINGNQLAVLESEVSYYCNTTAKKLNVANDLNFYYTFGSKGEKVHFTASEAKDIKNSGPAGLTLLGFRPIEDLKPKFNLKSSVFVVPDETQFTGSCSLFAHLVERIHAYEKVAFCRLIPRNGSVAKLVALIPQMASFDSDRDMAISEGFHMVYLPFADDIRTITTPEFDIPRDIHVEAAHKIIAKLQDPKYTIGNVKNPVLEQHFNYLYALALEKDKMALIIDETLPDVEKISMEAGAAINEFNLTTLDGIDDQQEDLAGKRKAPLSESKEVKKPKMAKLNPEDADNEEAIMKAVENGSIEKWTIPMLKKAINRKDEKPKASLEIILGQEERGLCRSSLFTFFLKYNMVRLKKLVLIGDSITEMASNPALFGWSAFLQTQYMRRLELVNRGLSGYNTRWYKYLIEPTLQSISIVKGEIELTVLMLGSNDCLDPQLDPKSNQAVPLEEYSQNLEALVKSIRKYSRRIIIVTCPPTDEKVCPTRPFERVNKYRMAGLELGNKLSIPVFDTWPLILGKEFKHDQAALDLVLSDGLHLNYAGNKVFGEGLFKFILQTWPDLEPESLKMTPRHWSTIVNEKLPECLLE